MFFHIHCQFIFPPCPGYCFLWLLRTSDLLKRALFAGKRAFIAGVADDNGYGWAIAKSLAAAGAEILLGTWVPVSFYFILDKKRVLISQYKFTWLSDCWHFESFLLCMYSTLFVVLHHLLTVNHFCRLWIFLSPAYDVENLTNHECTTLTSAIDFVC